LYLADPLICNRDNPRDLSAELWEKFFITGTQVVFARLQELGYTASAIRAADDRLLRDYVWRVTLARAREGANALALLKRSYIRFSGHAFFWLACVPAALTPSFLLRWATRLVRWRRARRAIKQGSSN
jgi:hypothetical protein